MSETIKVKYTGAALPGNAEVVTLFSTVTAFPGASYCAQWGLQRFMLSIVNDAASAASGLVFQVSSDRGTNWTTISAVTVGAVAASTDNEFDYAGLPGYADFRVVWTNSATPQTTWVVNMHFTSERAAVA